MKPKTEAGARAQEDVHLVETLARLHESGALTVPAIMRIAHVSVTHARRLAAGSTVPRGYRRELLVAWLRRAGEWTS